MNPYINFRENDIKSQLIQGIQTKNRRLSVLGQRFEKYIGNAYQADIFFILIDDGHKEVPAHKILLSTASATMSHLMFPICDDNLASKNEAAICSSATSESITKMKISKMSLNSMIELIAYIYTGGLILTKKNAYEILVKSRDFKIIALEAKCVDYLMKHLNGKIVCHLYGFLRRYYDHGWSSERCKKYIQRATKAALASDGLLELNEREMRSIYTLHSLNCMEFDLFAAALNWAKSECARRDIAINTTNKRIVLKNLIKCVRFRSLTLEQFQRCTELEEDFFTPEEITNIETCILNKCKNHNQRFANVASGLFFFCFK